MTAPSAWLVDVLAANAWRNLDTEASRLDLARQIAGAAPLRAFAATIMSSTRAVLAVRSPASTDAERYDLAREVGNNAAQAIGGAIDPDCGGVFSRLEHEEIEEIGGEA